MKKIVKKLIQNIRRKRILRSTKKDWFINDRHYENYKGVLSKEEIRCSKNFYKPYFKLDKQDISMIAYYKFMLGKYFKEILPDYYFYTDIKLFLNNQVVADAFDNKSYYSLFLDCKAPFEPFKKIDGGFILNNNYEEITLDDAIKSLKKNKEYIFKPSQITSGGKGIEVLKPEQRNEIYDFCKRNKTFVVQEIVKQHNVLSQFSKKSVNTIRTYSLFWDNKITILGSCLRASTSDLLVDNFCSGGFFVPINEIGELREYGITHSRQKINNINGILFKGIKIPGYSKMIDIIKKQHLKFPQVRFIGWDFAIDENGEPVFIEFNLSQCDPELLQIVADGPSFGQYQKEILEKTYRK